MPLAIDKGFESWAISLKFAGDAHGSFPSAQIKAVRHTGSVQSTAKPPLTSESKIFAPASAPDTGPLPAPLALSERLKTHRTEALNGTMVGFY